jgi:DNA (cytosine-5)-methyltransferase 1
MLTPRELARAMSFPDDYRFSGNRGDIVKQIGNAVDGSQAEALCAAVLR